MKKISLLDVKRALTRDDLRSIKGGSGPWCYGHPPCSHWQQGGGAYVGSCGAPGSNQWNIYQFPTGRCYRAH